MKILYWGLALLIMTLLAVHFYFEFGKPSKSANHSSVTYNANSEREQTCKLIKTYPRSFINHMFFNEGAPSPCVPYWQAQKDPKARMYSYYDVCVPEEFAKAEGELDRTSPKRPDEEREADFKSAIAAAAGNCCGGSQKCLDSFAGIKIRKCDPSAEKTCTPTIDFTWSENDDHDKLTYLATNVQLENADPSTRTVLNKRIQKVLAAHPGWKTSPPTLISGTVRYNSTRSTTHEEDLHLMRHELGHACLFIRNVVDLTNPPPARDNALFFLTYNGEETPEGTCHLHQRIAGRYIEIMSTLGETPLAPEVISCLRMTIANAGTGGKLAKCKGACPRRLLEEGLASILRTLSTPDLKTIFPEQVCGASRDQYHPMGSDVLECLLEHSPEFRAKAWNDLCK